MPSFVGSLNLRPEQFQKLSRGLARRYESHDGVHACMSNSSYVCRPAHTVAFSAQMSFM